jgi:molybdate transport system ATP-binding protein
VAVTALFGPSGAGKTSIVNAIAGLLAPESGRIAVNGALLFDSANGTDLPAHRRRVRVVFQESRLFPHLSVRQNLVYGRWIAGHAAGAKLDEVVQLLGLQGLLSRRPRSLSGGERQRVAIGRALLADPMALLLDEPLASLDEARKQEILPYLEKLVGAAKIPILYVSHAREEIERLAGTVVMLDSGRVKTIEEMKR